jgi:hypothetical protein
MRIELVAGCLALLLLAGAGSAQAQGVRWDDLSRAERDLLVQQQTTETTWAELAPQRQEDIARGARRWLDMNGPERQAAEERFRLWQDLSNDRRTEVRSRYEIYREMSPNDRTRLRELYQRFNRLPSDQRDRIRMQFRQQRSPDQLQRLRDRGAPTRGGR